VKGYKWRSAIERKKVLKKKVGKEKQGGPSQKEIHSRNKESLTGTKENDPFQATGARVESLANSEKGFPTEKKLKIRKNCHELRALNM